jgi:hypothetical protein
MLRYVELKEKPREFLAATGLTNEEFQCLLPNFEQAYWKLSPPKSKSTKKKKQRVAGGGRKGQLSEMAEKLLFVLVYQKPLRYKPCTDLHLG